MLQLYNDYNGLLLQVRSPMYYILRVRSDRLRIEGYIPSIISFPEIDFIPSRLLVRGVLFPTNILSSMKITARVAAS